MIPSIQTELSIQNWLGRLFVFITVPLLYMSIIIAGYRIRDIDEIRETVKKMYRSNPVPWIICAIHLTLIDSLILAYAMIPFYRYMFRYNLVPWNMPEKMNFNRNFVMTLMTFLAKCIPVLRKGDRSSVNTTLKKCEHLLKKNEHLMIFPEGTRSRNGRINTEEYFYGVGRLYKSVENCNVMCIYLRGDRQAGYSNYPAINQQFYMSVKGLIPRTELKGLRAQREYSRQIIETLSEMEQEYFDSRRK